MSLAVTVARALRRLGRGGGGSEPIARWASVRARTLDGVVADLVVDLLLSPATDAGQAQQDRALDTLEGRLRQLVLAARLEDLPEAGDALADLEGDTVEGFRVDRAVVLESEISVSPELRRLVLPDAKASVWI